jgi:hypothetical protein
MAIFTFVRRHLAIFGFSPTAPGEPDDLNGHMLEDGLGKDYWGQIYLDSEATNEALSNDGRAWTNCPLRYSLIASSAAIANTTTPSYFSKTITIPAPSANFLGINVAGTMVRVTAMGSMGTKASSPGGLVNAGIYRPTGNLVFGEAGAVPAFAGGLGGAGWAIQSISTVRTTGASGTMSRGALSSFPGVVGTCQAAGTLTTIDMTAAIEIGVAWAWATADVANTATLTQLLVEIAYPGSTVS